MTKKWIESAVDEQLVKNLQLQLGVSELICRLLVSRGITTYEYAKDFFRPSLEQLYDPFLMKNMQKAIDRISEAMSRNESIMLYGDYDVDGTMSVSLMYNFLIQRYDKISYYIPHRFHEGYGLSAKGVQTAKDRGCSLMITLDCGIKELKNIAFAQAQGIDVIVCDHHMPGEILPEAFAILDPKQSDCHYPYKELSGCGVAFKLISAMSIQECGDIEHAIDFIDLAAISTAADVVPLTGENRVILSLGILKINERSNPVLNEMIASASLKKKHHR